MRDCRGYPTARSRRFGRGARSNSVKPDPCGHAQNKFQTDANNFKAIRTRSGHTIELNNTEGEEKINIYDNEGSIITFDTQAKSLTINATENIEIGAKNIKIVAEENIDIQAKGNITKAAEGDVSIQSKGATDIQGNG